MGGGARTGPLDDKKEPAHQAKSSPVCRIRWSVGHEAQRSLMLRHRQIEAEPAEAGDERVNGVAGTLDFTEQLHAHRDGPDEEVQRLAEVSGRR